MYAVPSWLLMLSTEWKVNALGILNLTQHLTYSKGIFMYKVLNNNSPNYLAHLSVSHQYRNANSRNKLYLPRPRLYLFKTSISFAGAYLWNSLPQNIKSCISLPCFKCYLRKYTSKNIFLPNLNWLVTITCLSTISIVYNVRERHVILMLLCLCRNSIKLHYRLFIRSYCICITLSVRQVQMGLMLLSLSIKVFEFEFSLSLSLSVSVCLRLCLSVYLSVSLPNFFFLSTVFTFCFRLW